jgi:archaellum component FlaC
MFKSSNKEKIEALEEYIFSVKDCVEAIGRDFQSFNREIRHDISNLECTRGELSNLQVQLHNLVEKYDEAVEAGGWAVSDMKNDIQQLEKTASDTRLKFGAILNHLDCHFSGGIRLIQNEECSEEV